ncbi:MAG: sugar transporter [Pedobacter sp.]|jgi:polysaccharide export outer membrane protein|nr:sugar transporter [Pedobacter sp.]
MAFLCMILLSCGSYKTATYFQDVNREELTKEAIDNFNPITIQPGDILGISISSLNPESSAIFNFASNTATGASESSGGYLVDQHGDIQLPVLGTINVGNLTSSQIREKLKLKLTPYLKEPVVVATLMNFKVSIMGDVSNPGLYKSQGERLTIPEAISMAGDLNMTALRTLLIIREVNGERQYINVDLTKKSLFNSPYYYLKNNDIIYVQASRVKYSSSDPIYQRAGFLLSVFSVAAIFIFR